MKRFAFRSTRLAPAIVWTLGAGLSFLLASRPAEAVNWNTGAVGDLKAGSPQQDYFLMGAQTVPVHSETVGLKVLIENAAGVQAFSVTWHMNLKVAGALRSEDNQLTALNVNTNAMGYWEHLAGGDGALKSDLNLGAGDYLAQAHSDITAVSGASRSSTNNSPADPGFAFTVHAG
jgi:hypothetical protein